jgi:hypothetical protein
MLIKFYKLDYKIRVLLGDPESEIDVMCVPTVDARFQDEFICYSDVRKHAIFGLRIVFTH